MNTKNQTFPKHLHTFNRRTPQGSVETCGCGKFRFTEHAGSSIVEQRNSHTPGPWKVTEYGAIVAGSWNGTTIVYTNNGESCINGEANARLIAAAPELLAACKAAQQVIGGADTSGSGQRYAHELLFCAIDSTTQEGEARVRAPAEREARKAQTLFAQILKPFSPERQQ